MVGRDWSSALHHGHPEEGYLQLSWPVRGRTVPVAGVLSRGQGCLLGQFAGDSLGGLVEFEGADYIASHYPQGVRLLADGGAWGTIAGQPTDDSELALCLARSIVAAGGYDPEAAARAYAWWYNSGPFDKGDTTRQALIPAARSFGHGQSAADAARAAASTTSQANGAMMRVCPIGVAGASRSPDTVIQWARADAELTHPHPVCQSANAVFAEAIAFAIRVGASPAETYEHACATAAEIGAETSVRETLALAASAAPADYSKQQGWVLIALQNAFFQLLHAPDLEAGVVDSIMRGGDTDTNAAIAGALLGAVHGRDAIPSQWVDRILTCRPLEGLSGGNKSRPQAFWPVDALWLAELLLTATKGDAQP